MNQEPHVVVEIKWLIDGSDPLISLPNVSQFRSTAYRESLGIDDLFSIVVELTVSANEIGGINHGRIFSLVETMNDRLPDAGNKLIITSGHKPVAECHVLEKITSTASN